MRVLTWICTLIWTIAWIIFGLVFLQFSFELFLKNIWENYKLNKLD